MTAQPIAPPQQTDAWYRGWNAHASGYAYDAHAAPEWRAGWIKREVTLRGSADVS